MLHTHLLDTIESIGYIGLFFIVFAESGLFFGFFLPGDSLLFTTGLLASSGIFSLPIILILLSVAAITGDSVGYFFGRKVGMVVLKRGGSFFLKQSHIHKTELFYKKYGNKALFLGRFLPIIRTFAPILAGVGHMKYSTFLRYNIISGIVWVNAITLLGYALGKKVPEAEKYLLPIILGIVFISILPALREFISRRSS